MRYHAPSSVAEAVKLAAGTTLDLTAITGNQTVKTIQEVEVLQMQGNSALTLNANDVLSLGGSNASTTFGGTIGGSGGLVQTGTGNLNLTFPATPAQAMLAAMPHRGPSTEFDVTATTYRPATLLAVMLCICCITLLSGGTSILR